MDLKVVTELVTFTNYINVERGGKELSHELDYTAYSVLNAGQVSQFKIQVLFVKIELVCAQKTATHRKSFYCSIF